MEEFQVFFPKAAKEPKKKKSVSHYLGSVKIHLKFEDLVRS